MVTPPASLPAQIASLLFGGLAATLVVAWAVRRPLVRDGFEKARGVHLALAGIAMVAVGVAGATWAFRTLLEQSATGFGAVPPSLMWVLGASIGLPFAVPGVVAAWAEARRRRRATEKRRDYVATKDDRRAFAERLATQIMEMSPRPREVTASISGDGGTVLVLSGDIDAREGERLTVALREELADAGFKRMEGRSAKGDWWTRV